MGVSFRILLLDTAAQTHNPHIPLAVADALRRHPAVAHVARAGYGDALARFRAEACDTLLALGGAGGDLAILTRLCAMARRAALWTTEDPYEVAENLRVSVPFDAVFTNDLASLPVYGGRARHLPLAASLMLHDIEPVGRDEDFLYDVSFVGTAWPNRVRTVNRILSNRRRPLRMKVALPTNPHLPPVELVDPKLPTNWRVSNPDLARIANRSRVTLNLERRFSAYSPDQASGSTPPPRLFETALAGGFQISLGGSVEADRYFDPRTEVARCAGEDELLDRIDWALDHPEARIAMARASRERAKAEHLYDHRVAAVLAALAGHDRAPAEPRADRRAKVLLVTHNLAGSKPGGGVEVYQQKLADGARDFDVLTLVPENEGASVFYTLLDHRAGTRSRYGVPHGVGSEVLHDAHHERVFEQILIENEIDLVHFQHLLGMPLSLPLVAKACGVPSVYTAHDYYLVCASFNLIDYRGRFCDIANRSPTECDVCLASGGLSGDAQRRRRNFVGTVLDAVDRVVCNTPYTASTLRAIYPGLEPDRIAVVEMMTPTRRPGRTRTPARDGAGAPALQVTVPGNFTRAKGADAVIRVMNALRADPIDFHVLGAIQEPDLADHLRDLRLPRVRVRGGYESADLPGLLGAMDLSLHLSIWPETYMISLSEAWAAGVVPIVTDLGAPGERVRDGHDGFKVDIDDVGRVCDVLRAMDADRPRLEAMRANLAGCRIVSPAEHLRQLGALYAGLIRARPVASTAVPIRAERDYILTAAACGIRTNTPSWKDDGFGWDPAPRAPSRSASPSPAAQVWRTFPMRFGHLRRGSAAADRLVVERMEVDGRLVGRDAPAVRHALRIAGWAFAGGHGPALDVVLHLRGAAQDLYAASAPVPRLDVAEHLRRPEAAASGFDFELDLSGLREGRYEAVLLQVHDGVVLDLGAVAAVTVERGDARPAPAPVSSFDPEANGPPGVRQGDAAVARAPRTAREDEPVALEGWAADRAGRRVLPLVHLGFVRQGGRTAWVAATRSRAPAALLAEDALYAFCGFRLDLSPAALELGLHRIVVAQSDGAESLLHEVGEAVLVLPGRAVMSSRGTHPDADGRNAAPAPEHRITLDRADVLDAPGRPGAGGRLLYLRGWAFVPDLGRPAGLALLLRGAQASLRVPLAPESRPDVADHLGAPDAEGAGFEVLLTLGDLPPGRYEAAILYATDRGTVSLPSDFVLDTSLALAA